MATTKMSKKSTKFNDFETTLPENRIPPWYSGMSTQEKLAYTMYLPRCFKSLNTTFNNYQKEAEDNGWVLHKSEDDTYYYTHERYEGGKFEAIHYKPDNVSSEYYQHIPYVARSMDVFGLGYVLVPNTDGTSAVVKSNKWHESVLTIE